MADPLLTMPPNVTTPEMREWGKLEEGEDLQLKAMNEAPAVIIQKHALELRVYAALIACGQKGLAQAVGPSASDLVDYALYQVSDMDPEIPISMMTAMSIAASVSYYRAGLIDSQEMAYQARAEGTPRFTIHNARIGITGRIRCSTSARRHLMSSPLMERELLCWRFRDV